jgi:uncharacterized membrane protein (DUF106 family)
MWILDFLPFWVFHVITVAGVLGVLASQFMSVIPVISKYKLPILVGSILVLAFGLYMEGGITNQEKWEARVKEMEAKVAQAEAESAKENTKIVQKVVKQLEVVKVRGEEIVRYVDREVAKYDSQCVIPKEFVKAHNDAAEQPK